MANLSDQADHGRSYKFTKQAGEFLIGPKLANSPVKCIAYCLARKKNTDEFYTIKIMTQKDPSEKETIDDQQGKILMHTEYQLLSLLRGQKGVVQQYGLYKDVAIVNVDKHGRLLADGKSSKTVSRLCLVLDCYTPHDFCPKYSHLTNLQYYVIKEKKLSESEAVRIFYDVVQIVDRLHKQNVVHRDLKLGNIILNKNTKEVSIANFCLGKHLSNENDLLKDQRGSPAYISPDVISGKPYLGKPSDMWALGVVFYTMLYGQFPFYDQSPTELFRKIKVADYIFPVEHSVSAKSVELIQSLLELDPHKRCTSSDVLDDLREIISCEHSLFCDSNLQIVPDCLPGTERPAIKRTHADICSEKDDMCVADVEAILTKGVEVSSDDDEEKNLVHEPPRKVSRCAQNSATSHIKFFRVKEDARVLTVGDLKNLHDIYLQNKANGNAIFKTADSLPSRINNSGIPGSGHQFEISSVGAMKKN